MKNKFFIFIIMVLVSSLLVTNFAYGERNCDGNLVCVMPGDYVKFKNNLGSETLVEFEDEITNEQIILKWTSYKQNGSVDSLSQYILDRSSGSYTSLESSEFAEYDFDIPFMFVLKTPIPSEYNQQEFCKTIQHEFNGISREVIFCEKIEDEVNVKTMIDAKTGVVFVFDFDFGSFFAKQELLDTNIISSKDFTETRDKSHKQTKIQSKVPEWVKNNAKWWSSGEIDDGSFVQGIKYLIKEKIILVQETSSTNNQDSNEIPGWVKNTAKWWSDELITEDDFLKGVQYLVESGIINVNDSTKNYSVLPTYHNAVIMINAAQVNLGNIITLSIIDPDLNENPTSAESFSIDELSILVNDKISINPSNLSPFYTQFIETGFDTGIFQNQFTLKSSEIKLQSGDVIEFGYNDKTLNENEFPIDEELGGYISTSITVLDPVQPQNTQSFTKLLSEEEVVAKILDFNFLLDDYDSLIGRTVQQEDGENIISYGVYYEPDNEIIAGLVLFENDNGIHTISSGLEYELDKNKANHAIWILSTLHHKIIPVEKWIEDTDTVFIQWVINSILSLEETNQITVDGKTVTIVHEKPTSSFSNGHITIIIQY